MNLSFIRDYVQAGFDESLVKLVKGVFASAIVGASMYLYHHLTSHGLTIVGVAATMGLGTPSLLAFWHWVKTTAGMEKATSVTTVPVVDMNPVDETVLG